MGLTHPYRVCVSIRAGNVDEAVEMLCSSEKLPVDFAEIRLDYIKSFKDLSELPGSTNIPLIAAFRPKRQGGLFEGDEKERLRVLKESADAGFKYVDLELDISGLDELIEELRQTGVKVIVSHHDFDKTPSLECLRWLLSRELSYEPEVCKIVTYARSLRDNLTCLDLLSSLKRDVKVVCFAMGRLGLPSRVLSPLYGGFFTYSSFSADLKTAPGQPTVSDLRRLAKLMGVYMV